MYVELRALDTCILYSLVTDMSSKNMTENVSPCVSLSTHYHYAKWKNVIAYKYLDLCVITDQFPHL